jgi:hypothetical protein
MAEIIGHHLERMAACGQVDRRNGTCARWLLTAFGMAQLPRARTRTFRTLRVVQRCAGSGGPTSQGSAAEHAHRQHRKKVRIVDRQEGASGPDGRKPHEMQPDILRSW